MSRYHNPIYLRLGILWGLSVIIVTTSSAWVGTLPWPRGLCHQHQLGHCHHHLLWFGYFVALIDDHRHHHHLRPDHHHHHHLPG